MKATDIVCKLVHSSLFGGTAVVPAGTDWYSVFDAAKANRVCALCYKALNKVPKDARPDKFLTDKWKEYADNVRKNYNQRCRVTQNLCEKLSGYGIVMLLLGGNALADYYPQREFREDDSVRFTANPGYLECDSALKDMGLVPVLSGNDSYFSYKGVIFCHCAFLEQSNKSDNASIAGAIWHRNGTLQSIVDYVDGQLRSPWGRISMQAILDLSLFIRRYPYIKDQWLSQFQDTRQRRLAEAMICAGEYCFGSNVSSGWSKRQIFYAKLLSTRFHNY